MNASSQLIIQHLITSLSLIQDNTHRLTLSMSPDDSYLDKQASAEERILQEKISALSDGDKKDIYDKGAG